MKTLHDMLPTLLASLMMSGTWATAAPEDGAVKVKKRTDIKVVYQIKTDSWKDGVGSGLHYVEKLLGAYREMDIDLDEVQLSAVLHSDAGYWLLKDNAYRRETGQDNPNPNVKLVQDLIEQGASIELCAQTMKSHGWEKEDIIDGVTIVVGAYPRIIDLQLRGYAYIRF